MAEQEDAIKLVYNRNDFYRDNHHRIMRVLLISACVTVFLVFILLYIVMNPPPPRYFAVSADGRLTPIVGLTQPNLSQSAVLQWANQAAIAAYSYNFVNFRKELQAASEFFTPQGWQSFLEALENSNNLTAVKEKKLIVSAVATGAPVILYEGLSRPDDPPDRYRWKIQMPLLVTYQSSSQISSQSLVVTMIVTRVSTLYSARGIGIEQFVVSEG